ncbi:MAG: thiol-disulfide isomerase [Actinomycetota bacterium]
MSGWWLVSYVVLWALVALLVVLVVALARQIGLLHVRLGPRGALEMDDEGPPLGEAPEPAEMEDLTGRPAPIGGPGAPQLLVFVSPSCPMCREVLPSVRPAARAGGLKAYAVVDAEAATAREAYGPELGLPVVASPVLAHDYLIPGTPYAVVLDAVGVVRAKGTANNLEQLEGLLDTARRRVEAAP